MNRRELEAENERLHRAHDQNTEVITRQQAELNARASEIDTHLRKIGDQAQIIHAMRSQQRTVDIRLAVLNGNGWSSLPDLAERADWVLTGAVPTPAEPSDDPVKVITHNEEMAEGPRAPEIRRDSLLSSIVELEYVLGKIGEVRYDPNLSTGKVRIQTAHTRLHGVVLDLKRIAEGGA